MIISFFPLSNRQTLNFLEITEASTLKSGKLLRNGESKELYDDTPLIMSNNSSLKV